MTATTNVATRLRRTACTSGTYLLPTGEAIEDYFDEYRLAADPSLLHEVADALAELVPTGCEVLAGLELGGIPLVVALSAATGLPAAFVRRRAKPYGTFRQVEGAPVTGRTVALVDDVARSGSQLLRAAQLLRDQSAAVPLAVCILERSGTARQRLAGQGIDLHVMLNDTSESEGATVVALPTMREEP